MTRHPPAEIDATRCPLCGQPNQCALELERCTGVEQGPCWCTAVRIAPAVLARIPPAGLARACICPSCASADAAAPSVSAPR